MIPLKAAVSKFAWSCRRTAVLALLPLGLAAPASALTWRVDYDASLGTLPSAQSWTHTMSDPASFDGLTEANYSVSGGVLAQGPTGDASADACRS